MRSAIIFFKHSEYFSELDSKVLKRYPLKIFVHRSDTAGLKYKESRSKMVSPFRFSSASRLRGALRAPKTYKNIAKQLADKRLDREAYMNDMVDTVTRKLLDAGIKAHVYGRPKHIFSIYKKMSQKNYEFDQLFDIRAMRIVVEQIQDCYGALGIVHTNWKHLPKEFDDYVATPKQNGYQSIHTVVFGPEGKTIEIQIRTDAMHQDAELGVAAHWVYKEGALPSRAQGMSKKLIGYVSFYSGKKRWLMAATWLMS